jgi:Thiolase, N-terminal domain
MTMVQVAGVGMVPFATPSKSEFYDVMAGRAIRAALVDAGIALEQVQQAYAGYVYGDSTSGQKALYAVGKTGIPVVNVNNNCSTGSSALWLARQTVASGAADCVLAFGFEQMERGALAMKWADRPSPFVEFMDVADRVQGQVTPRSRPSYSVVPARLTRTSSAPSPRLSPASRSRRARTPRTTRTQCSANQSRSTRCWPPRRSTARSLGCSAARRPAALPPR